MENKNSEEKKTVIEGDSALQQPILSGPDSIGGNKIKLAVNKKTIIIAVIIVIVAVIGILAYHYRGLVIAATVNGSPISRLEVVQRLEKASGKSLLDSMITEKLIKDEAAAKKITVSNDEINAEIKKYQDQFSSQGGTLDAALASQNMTMNDLKDQIVIQLDVEKLLGDKISVSDAEVAQYIKDNKVTIAKGQEATTTDQVRNNLKNQKLNTEAPTLISDLKSKAKIQYLVNY